MNKLYCTPGVSCPVDLAVSMLPPPGTVIRAQAVYSKPEHIHNLVTRCQNHQKKKQFETEAESRANENILAHLIRCRHAQTIYEEDPLTMRHSVVIPYEQPPGKI